MVYREERVGVKDRGGEGGEKEWRGGVGGKERKGGGEKR